MFSAGLQAAGSTAGAARQPRDDQPEVEARGGWDAAEWNSAQWRALTRHRRKPDFYRFDSYFAEAAFDCASGFGPHWTSEILQYGLIVFKPEAVVGRRVNIALASLEAREFSILALAPITFDSAVTHALWRYQLNFATLDRLRLQTVFRPATPTICAIVTHQRKDDCVTCPVQVRLKGLKGAAQPEQRSKSSLRELLAAPNALLNFVHAPDEPADLVREMGVLWNVTERRALIRLLCSVPPALSKSALHGAVARLNQENQPHDLAPRAALLRLGRWIAQLPVSARQTALRDGIVATLAAAEEQPVSLPDLEHRLMTIGADVMAWPDAVRWDAYVGLSGAIVRDRERVKALIHDDDGESWPC